MLDALHRDVTWATLEQGMRGLSRREQAIAVNVDNVNTPGYKRHEIDFKTGLREALAGSGNRTQLSSQLRGSESREFVIDTESFNNDLNGVDIEHEMKLLAETSIDRATNYSLMQKKLRTYKMVMRDGR
ncbi:flagellar basal body rod protein FlgB [bacterium]|nr:flagellar basal body rod protein FlgB [bacterium]MCB1222166.1 flagellar basal body rod protein FlgB [bacterium]UNM08648.1 MAG: flagellar basal body rod protein FlgB [Planctomycetales bacterium]